MQKVQKIGRNDPCWCGSGHKYKDCHLDFDAKLSEYRRKGSKIPTHAMIKNPEQIAAVRESAKINVAVLDYVAEHIHAGITTEQIDLWVYEQTTHRGGIPAPLNYEGFPKSVCTSVNDQVCHGIPSADVILKDGDIINVDFSTSTNVGHGGKSTLKVDRGTSVGKETGKKNGAMIGLSVDQSGKIYASYDNGNTELLGQIAVAQFANASGLEKIGDNCYQTTLNSGEFDGVGVAVDADGSKINSGQLEMSNVDLSGQFTDMIITQRGFQANSRVITVSDTLLEELINLKR